MALSNTNIDKKSLVNLLTIISLVLWLISVITSNLNLGNLGLADALSPLYFLSLLVLFVAFILSLRVPESKYLHFVQIFLLVAYLFLTPSLIEMTPRFRSAYPVLGFSEYIQRNFRIAPSDILYHNWPGGSLINFIIIGIAHSIDSFTIAKYFPFAIELLYFLPCYTSLKYVLRNDTLTWVGLWIFYMLNFTNQDYFSPQAIAFLFFLILLSLIFKLLVSNDHPRINKYYMPIIILLYAFVCITHMLTSMLIIIILLIAIFMTSVKNRSGKANNGISGILRTFYTNLLHNKIFFALLAIFLIFFAFWTLYGASTYLSYNLKSILTSAFDTGDFLSKNIGNRVAGSSSHQLISTLMVLSAFSTGLIAMLAFVYSLYKKNVYTSKNLIFFAMLVVIGLFSLFYPYGGEMIIRVFLFSIPVLVIYLAQGYANKLKALVIVFMLCITLLHVVLHYGNEIYDYVPSPELKSYDFFYDHSTYGTDHKNSIISGYPTYDYKATEENMVLNFEDVSWDGTKYFNPLMDNDSENYVLLTESDLLQYGYYFNDSEFLVDFEKNLSESYEYNKPYDSSYTSIFVS
jgi:hypothetical protein